MKHHLRKTVFRFIGKFDKQERSISDSDLSVVVAVLIAVLMLRNQKASKRLLTTYDNFFTEFDHELSLLRSRFSDLFEIFIKTVEKIREPLISAIFSELISIVETTDEDADDLISWSYQYIKRETEKSAFQKLGKNNQKIEDKDLLYTTQFFTDQYMVEHLVNRILLPLDRKEIENSVVIDPACGGGNFLTYSFDTLFRKVKSLSPKTPNQIIVDDLLENRLLGFDLDHQLSRIASLSLFIKACSYCIPSATVSINIYGGIDGDLLGFLDPDFPSIKIGNRDFSTEFQAIAHRNKTKLFLSNPPFMGKRDMDQKLKDFLLANFPESKGDLCVTFIQRMGELMSVNDVLGIVSQKSWMFLSSFKSFRQYFLSNLHLRECIDLGTKAFSDISGEKTNVTLCVITAPSSQRTTFHDLSHQHFKNKRILVRNQEIPAKLKFRIDQDNFLDNQGFEFNYRFSSKLARLRKLSPYTDYANPMQGTSTGNNKKFVKYCWEVNGDRDWKLVSKGGGFCKWAGLNYFKVLWGDNAEPIKSNKGSALRNIDKMQNTHLVFSDTGTLGLNVRILKPNQVFIASGPGIQVLKGNKYAHLAYLNSRIATYLLKISNPKFTLSAGYIGRLPVSHRILSSLYISNRSKKCLELKDLYLNNKLPNIEFRHHAYNTITSVDAYLEQRIIDDLENEYERISLEFEIELRINELYKFTASETADLYALVGAPSMLNKRKGKLQGIEDIDLFLSTNLDGNCLPKSRLHKNRAMGSDNLLEQMSFHLNSHPYYLLHHLCKNVHSLRKTKSKYLDDLIHKIALFELGFQGINNIKSTTQPLDRLITTIKTKYPNISDIIDVTDAIPRILTKHHKACFFNKPIVQQNGQIVKLGQETYG